MVKVQPLTQEQLQTLKKLAECPIVGPCSQLSIDTAEILKIAQQVRVEVKK